MVQSFFKGHSNTKYIYYELTNGRYFLVTVDPSVADIQIASLKTMIEQSLG